MSSPVKIPFKSVIRFDRSLATPVYVQIARQFINAIQRGVLVSGVKLPGSRALSEILTVHRKTIVMAYSELDTQGWIETLPNKGTFVTNKPPLITPDPLKYSSDFLGSYPSAAGFAFKRSMLLDRPSAVQGKTLELTDGLPDVRLAPLEKLAKTYSGILKRTSAGRYLGYAEVEGNSYYRNELASYLNNTRGLHIRAGNVLSCRGIQMGLYLAAMLLLAKGDRVLVGQPSYYVPNMIFQQAGARIMSIPIDDQGIRVDAVRELCVSGLPIRLLYITPHHHYPTTVTLSAERRLELLQLSSQYGFIILEDDHDFDFHYQSSAVLPLASADTDGMVVYVGSFCKALAPGLRAGYIVAPENVIEELGKLRRIVDRQGDLVMEQALGEMLHEGEIQRHLKKALKIYHQRRDAFSVMFATQFAEFAIYEDPPGGLAAWTDWRKDMNLLKISRECLKNDVYLPQSLLFQTDQLSGMRLGFGNLTEPEAQQALTVMADAARRSVGSNRL